MNKEKLKIRKIIKNIIFTFFIIIALVLIAFTIFIVPWEVKPVSVKSENYTRIVTYNIKYAQDWLDTFDSRKEIIKEQLSSYEADIIAVQEANYGWMNNYDGLPILLEEYNYVGVGREDGKEEGEYAAIFYLKSKYEVLESNTIWLSQTPNEVSIGWDASTYRIMTYVTLKNKETEEVLTIYNTHLDHIGEVAKEESTNLILEKINNTNNPYILVGDLNFPTFNKLYDEYTELLDDSYNIAKDKMKYGTINYNYNLNFIHFIRIDYVFMSKDEFEVINYRIDPTYKFEDKPVSDHFPIIVDFKIK